MKVGLIGWGIGSLHGRCYQAMPDVQVVAVADVRPERLQKAVDLLGARPFSSAQELLEQADVDLVDICLPTYLHAEYTTKALARGCHVLCEKPMALDAAQCDTMIAAAQRAGKKLMIAHCVRFWPEYHYLKTVYDEGVFGRLQVLSLTRVGGKTTISYDNWQLDPARSGSQTLDRHIHDTDYVLHLLGKPAAVRSVGHFDDAGLSHVSTQYIYPEGPAVFAEGGGNMPRNLPFSASFRAVFDRAALEYAMDRTPTLKVYPWEGEPYVPEYNVSFAAEAEMAETGANLSSLGAYYNEIRYYVDCLKQGREPAVVTLEQAKQAVLTAKAEIASAEAGREIAL